MVVLLGMAGFLYYAVVRAPRPRRAWAIVAAVAVTLVLFSAVSWLFVYRYLDNLDRWRWLTGSMAMLMPVVLYGGIGLGVVAVVNLVWWIVRDARGPRLARAEVVRTPRLRFVRTATVGAVVAALAMTGYGYAEAHRPALSDVSVSSADLPAQFDGFRIALLSDIHVGVGLGKSFVQGVVDQVNDAQVDLVVIAGDLSNGSPSQLGADLMPLTELRAGFGVLVTTGNHEYDTDAGAWIDWLNSHTLPVLDNSGVVLSRGTASIDVLGVNDRSGRPPHQDDLLAAVSSLSQKYNVPMDGAGRFRLLIAHQPLQDAGRSTQAAELGVDVQLSGHTHGGQLWPMPHFITMQQPVLDGTHVLNGVTVVTGRGAGAWGPPVRIGAPPEIPIITLHRA